jgi:hypothetical protein
VVVRRRGFVASSAPLMTKPLLVVVLVVACGGGKKASTTPEPADDDESTQEMTNDESAVVSPDTMDQIKRMFERKAPAVSRCLSMVVDNKELPKNSRGRITLEVTITPSGAPGQIRVVKASLDNQALTDCILDKVREIRFPEVPHAFPSTYTYGFEAN